MEKKTWRDVTWHAQIIIFFKLPPPPKRRPGCTLSDCPFKCLSLKQLHPTLGIDPPLLASMASLLIAFKLVGECIETGAQVCVICCASTSGSPSDPLTPFTLALSSPGPGWILFITISRFGLKYMGTCSDMDTRMGERCGPLAAVAAFNLWMHVLVQGRQLKLIFAK